MRKMTYIGITGVKSRMESEKLLKIVRALGLPPTHRVMIGGLASYKTLAWGKISDPTQYLTLDQLSSVLIKDSQFFNALHYNSRAKGLTAQVEDLLDIVGTAAGIQLNILWPHPSLLRQLKDRYYTKVILQVSSEAAAMLGHDPRRIVARLAEYEGLIDYALLDPSGGVGKAFVPTYIAPILEACVASNLDIGWGVAGGLGAGRLSVLEPLLEICPELSWDAQARLRSADGQVLDLAACEQYLREGIALLHKQPGRGSTFICA